MPNRSEIFVLSAFKASLPGIASNSIRFGRLLSPSNTRSLSPTLLEPMAQSMAMFRDGHPAEPRLVCVKGGVVDPIVGYNRSNGSIS